MNKKLNKIMLITGDYIYTDGVNYYDRGSIEGYWIKDATQIFKRNTRGRYNPMGQGRNNLVTMVKR